MIDASITCHVAQQLRVNSASLRRLWLISIRGGFLCTKAYTGLTTTPSTKEGRSRHALALQVPSGAKRPVRTPHLVWACRSSLNLTRIQLMGRGSSRRRKSLERNRSS